MTEREAVKMQLNAQYGKYRETDAFVTQIAVSEKRYATVERLEETNRKTGKEFPVSGDAKLRMERQLLKARIEGIRKSLQEGLLEPPC